MPGSGGFIAWRGLSRFTGDPIAVVVTCGSSNRKTGDMDQAWIIRSDVHPLHATRTGADVAICGTCRHRNGGGVRSCYVTVQHGPAAIFRALVAGRYADLTPDEQRSRMRGRVIRFGAYGDPASAPSYVWSLLSESCAGWTGYTHFWRTCDQRLRHLLMASCDTEAEARCASEMGWRTFRVRQGPLHAGEIACPASAESGHRTTCGACLLCNGVRPVKRQPANIAILPHGPKVTFFRSSTMTLFPEDL